MLPDIEVRATKLRKVLNGLGHQLDHSDCVDVITKTTTNPQVHHPAENAGTDLLRAEQYLDELLVAVSELSYRKFTQRFEEKYLVLFTERDFKLEIPDTFNEFGSYVRREFLGSLNGFNVPGDDRHPNEIRYFWRCFFEKNEALIMVCIYRKHGTYYISSARSL